MKKIKSLLIIFIVAAMIFGCTASIFSSKVYAENEQTESDDVDFTGIYGLASDEFEFNVTQLLRVYGFNGGTSEEHPNWVKVLSFRHDLNDGVLVPVNHYINKEVQPTASWQDGVINGTDATEFLAISIESNDMENLTKSAKEAKWREDINDLVLSLVDGANISENDILIRVKIDMPEVTKYEIPADHFEMNTTDGIDEQVYEKYLTFKQYNHIINAGENNLPDNWVHQLIRIIAETTDGGEWKVVIGTDNNFYWLQTKAPEVKEFKTTLEYEATVEDVKGKMDGDTFLPPYFDNDNAKKDSDAIAIIKSKTEEGIKSTNGVDLKEDGKPNSEGWYYPDVEDKTVIAKKYVFDDYDNTTDNGMVKETVKLTGTEDGEDTQTPSIKWTFRRKTKAEKENDDGSVTVTITYNLPVDPESIPADWKPVYDKDGKTIHAIEKTIKKGEDYEKDVIVKQNGTDATVTTPVKKIWPKDNSQADTVIPQTGVFTIILAVIIIGATVFAITRYRKINK